MTMRDLWQYILSLFSFDSSHPLLFTQIHFWVLFLFIYAGFALITGRQRKPGARQTLRNAYLFAFSLLFYYKTSGLFVLLLVGSTLTGWLLGIGMDRLKHGRKAMCAAGVVLNLAVLCFFKYAYFFLDIFNATFHTEHSIGIKILLPVGISFFTFQNISYIVDVYRRKIAHVGNILDFGFYTAFFPQLVAGPILRADQFVPQLYRPFFLSRRQFGVAVFWICNGLIKKLVLSDYLAVSFVDRVFENPLLYTPFENLSALMLYSLQVYADFSGYTDIAIGVAMLMGFYLPVNFNSPYKAQNPTDFWHRWHMSLSRWLRDYLYIPLGGNRSAGFLSYFLLFLILAIAAFRLQSTWFTVAAVAVAAAVLMLLAFRPSHRRTLGTNVNNMDTMLLGGLWHGASFNFITWGGLNGLGILAYKWWHPLPKARRVATVVTLALVLTVARGLVESALLNVLAVTAAVAAVAITLLECIRAPRLYKAWNILFTFVFISFTRLFFRSGSNLDPAEANEVAWQTASQMMGQIGSAWNLRQVPEIVGSYWQVFLLFALGMAVHWLPTRFKRRYRLWFAQMPLWLMGLFVVLMALVLYQFVTADLQPFIYFQF
ncbi:MAG: MBOAT family protein [Bacteroidales bacterium]|nr:MBOAT family protein [Bacteroidales bacterium]